MHFRATSGRCLNGESEERCVQSAESCVEGTERCVEAAKSCVKNTLVRAAWRRTPSAAALKAPPSAA
eukprot:6181279-Pleurochrysis_carterae.AAC.2